MFNIGIQVYRTIILAKVLSKKSEGVVWSTHTNDCDGKWMQYIVLRKK